jgi:hypothetical protein
MSVAAASRRSRATPRDWNMKLDPRVTRPPDILSHTPVTNETGLGGVTPGRSSWGSSTGAGGSSHSSASARSSLVRLYSSQQPQAESLSEHSCSLSMYRESPLDQPRKLHASKILPNLWLGSEHDTYDVEMLRSNNIRYILNVAAECHPNRSLADRCVFEGIVPDIDEDFMWNARGDDTPMHSPDLTDGGFEMLDNRTTTFRFSSTPALFDSQFQTDCNTARHSSSSHAAATATPLAGQTSAQPGVDGSDKLFTYMYVPLKDSIDTDIQPYFSKCASFIRRALQQNEGVLVHCRAGVSRSATMVIAYLMLHGMNLQKPSKTSFDAAFERVHSIRPMVNPNIAFGVALRSLDQSSPIRTHSL